MNTVITPEMVREAYTIARRVYEKQLTRQEGGEELVQKVKYNRSSAADAIDTTGRGKPLPVRGERNPLHTGLMRDERFCLSVCR
jgi:hypothetical protein